MPMLKVFVPRAESAALAEFGQIVETYDAFTIVDAGPVAVRRLVRSHPVEDISDQYLLPLGGAEVDPLGGAAGTEAVSARATVASRSRRALARSTAPPDDAPHHYLLQFVAPPKPAWLTALKRAGATPRHPTSGFGYVVKADGEALARLRELRFVRWVGHLPHADRVAPAITGAPTPVRAAVSQDQAPAMPRRRVLPGALTVDVFDAADLPRIAREAVALGFTVLAQDKPARRLSVLSEATEAQTRQRVQALSTVHGVRWIAERVLPRTSNNVAAGIVGQTVVARPANGLGLSGHGEIVAVCDTGLDTGEAATIHPDFAGRIVAIKSFPIAPYWTPWVLNPGANDGAADVDSGHGTHVAGSVLGDGSASANGPLRIQGTAPAAKLVFQAIEQFMRWRPGAAPPGNPRYLLSGLPDALGPLFQHAYRLGARIHSNSWGGGDPGRYDEQCRQFDDFVWRNKDMCFVIAAGNDGSDRNGDGKIDEGSVTSPGTAKNCITVGASENLRPEFNTQRYGDWWPNDFPVPPPSTDPMANNAGQLAAFSSRGPCSDGRTKPDVVAPGTFILSTRSTQLASNNFAWAAYPPNRKYFHMGGTSMATPLVSGCLALIREHVRKSGSLDSPSAALLKAVLIAGAQRLPGLAAPTRLLDNAQGFGRVNLERSLRRLKLASEGTGLRSGEMSTSTLKVSGSSRTLRVVMAYSDFPGEGLINNLNLIVTAPGGRRYVGNQGAGSGLMTMDSRNNVEVVQVSDAPAGTWTFVVVASSVTQGPQDFALAAVLI